MEFRQLYTQNVQHLLPNDQTVATHLGQVLLDDVYRFQQTLYQQLDNSIQAVVYQT